MTEPALPWAAADKSEAQASDVKEDRETPLTLEAAGLACGGRVEVKWQVMPDEGESYSRWWGATIVGPSDQQDAKHPGAPVYELEYDAHDDFEPEHSHVVFTADHLLDQLDQADELKWRREGDEWEEDEDATEEGDEAADGEAEVTMDDLKQMVQHEKEMLGGKTLEEAEHEVLGALEPSKRIAVAAGFRDFADNLMSFLHQQVAASEGGEVVVTEQHVRTFMETMNKKPRTR